MAKRRQAAAAVAAGPQRGHQLWSLAPRKATTGAVRRPIMNASSRWSVALALLLPAVAVVELIGNRLTERIVPPMSSFERAAEIVRRGHLPGDLVVFAPDWMSQTRVALGEWISLEDELRGDTFDRPRLWELALDGRRSPETAGMTPLERHPLDRLTLTLYRNDTYMPALWRAHDEWRSARVTIGAPDGEKPCPWQEREGRHSCAQAAGEPWVWVGQVFISDVGFRPRRCLWAHPTERGPMHVTFADVPAGTRLTGHTGLTYAAFRDVNQAPVFLDVEVDGALMGRTVHPGDVGWTTFVYDLPPGPATRTIRFTVTTPSQGMRHFCFDAAVRAPPEDAG